MTSLTPKFLSALGDFEINIVDNPDFPNKLSVIIDFEKHNPRIGWIDKDFRRYADPANELQEQLQPVLNYITESLKQTIKDCLSVVDQTPDEIKEFTNGFSGEPLHDVEAIEIVTSKNMRIRVWQKFIFPKNKDEIK